MPTLLVLLLLLCSCAAACDRSCGNTTVSFPFGFSPACTIPLTCVNDTPFVGTFPIRSFSSGTFLVGVAPSCTRSTSSLYSLSGPNFAPTSNNSLLVRNCTAHSSGCAIPSAFLNEHVGTQRCDLVPDNITCFYVGGEGDPFLRRESVEKSGCSLLYSSIAYVNLTAQVLSFELQTMEVGWWVEGSCQEQCRADALCHEVTSPFSGKVGVACACRDGFVGDGFVNGSGCQKKGEVSSNCNPSKYISGGCGGKTRVVALIIGIVAGAVFMAFVAIVCCYIRRHDASMRTRKSTKRLLSDASCSIPLYPYKEIERATDNFSDANRLGTGAYGTVYLGTIHNDEQMAIKKLRNKDSNSIEQVFNEIKLLSSVSHPNLVRILGCCIDKDEQILVYEYMPNGPLSDHLQRRRGRGLPWTVRLNIASDTAKAIAYLHSAVDPPIYHRDIKSSNILLDNNFKSKLADFGLSKMIITESSHVSTAPQGTPGYLDPQYHQNFHLSDKSDVYSFGVVLVEIITALKVVDFSRGQSEVNLAALAVNKIGRGCVEEIIDPFLDPHRDAWTLSSIHKVAELAFRCLAFHKDMRPSMIEVADELEQIRLSGWAPSDENMLLSRQSSACSSLSYCTNTDRMQVLLRSNGSDYITMRVEKKCDSPLSAEDPWFSEQSSPSANSLLGHVAR